MVSTRKNIHFNIFRPKASLVKLTFSSPITFHLSKYLNILALKTVLDKRENHSIPTENLVKMAEFVLKNNFFEFNGLVKEQISGTAIGTKCAPNYACIFMDEFETKFIEG